MQIWFIGHVGRLCANDTTLYKRLIGRFWYPRRGLGANPLLKLRSDCILLKCDVWVYVSTSKNCFTSLNRLQSISKYWTCAVLNVLGNSSVKNISVLSSREVKSKRSFMTCNLSHTKESKVFWESTIFQKKEKIQQKRIKQYGFSEYLTPPLHCVVKEAVIYSNWWFP